MTEAQSILLDTGTNELEIVEFYVGNQSYGVNVAKVKQMMAYEDDMLHVTPDSHPHVKGVVDWQGQVVRMIDLHQILGCELGDVERRPMMVTEFNECINAYLTDGINRIHRVSWDEVKPVGKFMEQYQSPVLGTVHMDDRDILILDLEAIIAQIDPDRSVQVEVTEDSAPVPDEFRILIAEDSTLIRNTLVTALEANGFGNVRTFENGADLYTYLTRAKEKCAEKDKPMSIVASVILSDIEMPRMDGLTLCKNVREELNLDTPFIVFSSLVKKDMIDKAHSVGATDTIPKNQTAQLITKLRELAG